MCGEKADPYRLDDAEVGSPPRVRGKGCESCDRPRSAGITPACAGKSSRPRVATARGRDHPRVCGEKAAALSQSCAGKGSPPRVRGKAYTGPTAAAKLGITPACAGKRAVIAATDAMPRDHPRVCGEKRFGRSQSGSRQGSPPRVRGKAAPSQRPTAACRITPACAGKSKYAAILVAGNRDHPRVCGEKLRHRKGRRQHVGSPPRVRGKEPKRLVTAVVVGITPACAGKSSGST